MGFMVGSLNKVWPWKKRSSKPTPTATARSCRLRREQRRARPFSRPSRSRMHCSRRPSYSVVVGIPGDLLHRTRGAHRRQRTGGIAMRRFGLIGRPLGRLASAAYFAAKFEREGIADCTCTLYELPENRGAGAPAGGDSRPVRLQRHDPLQNARSWRCSTTCRTMRGWSAPSTPCAVRQASRLVGHNTDVIGLRAAFDCLLGGEQPSHALVLGTGGASQAVQYVLAERGIPFDLVSRDAARATTPTTTCRARPWSRAAS